MNYSESVCKFIGHKWVNYNDGQKIDYSGFSYIKDSEFRICRRCSYKQVRDHHTGRESDWSTFELTKEELREKKLKDLGIE